MDSDREQRRLRRNALREDDIRQREIRQMRLERDRAEQHQYRDSANQYGLRNENNEIRLNRNSEREQCRQSDNRDDRRNNMNYPSDRYHERRPLLTNSEYQRTQKDVNRERLRNSDIDRDKVEEAHNERLTVAELNRRYTYDSVYNEDSDLITRGKDDREGDYEVIKTDTRNKECSESKPNTRRKSVSFDERVQTGDENTDNDSDNSVAYSFDINLTEEMLNLDRKLALLRENNADILDKNNVTTDTRSNRTQDMSKTEILILLLDKEIVKSEIYESDTRSEQKKESKYKDTAKYEDGYTQCNLYDDRIEDDLMQSDGYYKPSYSEFPRRFDQESEGVYNSDRNDRVYERNKHSKDADYKYGNEYKGDYIRQARRYREPLATKHDEYIDRDERLHRVEKESIDPYSRQYREEEFRMTKEDLIQKDIERECILMRNLEERNRQIDLERKVKEEEEQKIMKRIQSLKLAESELERRRMDTERLQKEIEKKAELVRLRTERLTLLKSQEEELAYRLERVDREANSDRWRNEDRYAEDSIHFDRYSDINRTTDTSSDRHRYRENRNNSANSKSGHVRQASDKFDTETLDKDRPRYPSVYGKPKIPPFDGTDFKVWKIEVECIIKSKMYAESLIAQTMRNSLKGQTRKVLLTIDPLASSNEILRKLEDIYRTTQTEDSIMQDFFNAKQEEKETTSDWAIRLESVMQLAVETGEIAESKNNSLLKQRFWKGLKSEKLRNNTRVTYESSANFEQLRKKTRVEEEELKRLTPECNVPKLTESTKITEQKETTPIATSQDAILQLQQMKTGSAVYKQMSMMQQLMDKMNRLEKEIENLRKEGQDRNDTESFRPHTYDSNSYRGSYSRSRRPYRRPYYGPPRQPSYRDYYDKQSHRYSGPPNTKDNATSTVSDNTKSEDKSDKETTKGNLNA